MTDSPINDNPLKSEHVRRIMAGMERARANGTRSGKAIGRPSRKLDVETIQKRKTEGATITQLQREFRIGRGHVQRVLRRKPDLAA